MKLLAAVFLFLAFSARIHADDLDAYLLSDVDETASDRHPFVQCKIDLYDCIRLDTKNKTECLEDYKDCMLVLVPTLPPFVTACKQELKGCIATASGILDKARCIKAFGKCLINKGPVSPAYDESLAPAMSYDDSTDPPRHPYVQCKIDLYDCFMSGNKILKCLEGYKDCMAVLLPTLPPFVVACSDELPKCLKDASSLPSQFKCFIAFSKCLINKGPPPSPGEVALDAIEAGGPAMDGQPGFLQCKKDLLQCLKDKPRTECFPNYRKCLEELIPPYVKQCFQTAKECRKNAGGYKEKFACYKDLVNCLKNGAPSVPPPS